MKKYVLIPGLVKSRFDGQTHHIGAMALAQLYGVHQNECITYEPAPWWPPSFYTMAEERHKGLIKLTPRSDGNYTLPTAPQP